MKEMEYAHWAMQVTQVCMYAHTHGRLPRLARSEGLSLESAPARARLVQRLSNFVRVNDLADRTPAKKLKMIVQATEDAATNRLSDVDDGALLLATIINMTDVIARDQRAHFADRPAMRQLVRNLTGIMVPVTRRIFGATLPNEVRQAWPEFAKLFDAHKPSLH
jgi:hypothetical protein